MGEQPKDKPWKRCRLCGVRLQFEDLTIRAIEKGERPQLCMKCLRKTVENWS